MATNILMPALSPTMTEGTLARWLKKEGDAIKAGDVIAEIETDKATMEVEAVDEGVLGKILVADGTEGVAVNAPIAILIEAGEAVPSEAAPVAAAPPAAALAPPPAAGEAAKAVPDSAPPMAQPASAAAGDRVVASPLAKRMAQQAGVDLSALKGSGPHGRIVKADVEAASKGGAKAAPPVAAPAAAAAPAAKAPAPAPVAAKMPSPAITAPHTTVANSSMRKVIARRLSEAKATVPHFYVSMDIEIDALLSCGRI